MKRKLLFWAGGTVLLVVLFALASARNARDPRPEPRRQPEFDVGIPTAKEVRAMLGVYGKRVESTEQEVATLRADLTETRKALKESFEALAAERERREERPRDEKPTEVRRAARFRTFEFEKAAPRGLAVPAGSFGEATLLTGVYAPTGGEPLPVLLRLEAALIGPSRSRVPLRNAFLVGKAQGDANSKRAVVQIETLSLVLESGEAVEAKTNGWVVDDDGVQGLAGTYVWRADEILALSGLTAGLSAGADASAAREATSQINPLGAMTNAITGDPLRFAGQKALSGAFGKMSEVIGARLTEIVPAIYVTNGKRVTVAFISGVTLPTERGGKP